MSDPFFPNLFNALDSRIVASLIQQYLGGSTITSCKVKKVKYEPHKKCHILYQVEPSNFYLFGEIVKEGDDVPLDLKNGIFLSELSMILYYFPDDPVMGHLSILYDPEKMQEHLRFMDPSVQSVEIQPLDYTPEMRATFQYTIDSGDEQVWIGKTNALKKASDSFATHRAIWEGSQGKFRIAKPISYLHDLSVTFQEKIPGERLGALVDFEHFGDYLLQTAESIAHFHQLSIPLKSKRTIDKMVRSLDKNSRILVQLCPDLEERIVLLKETISKNLDNITPVHATIHADFHHTNLLVDGMNVSLIDLEDVAIGDPCIDLGRFLSSLRAPFLKAYGGLDEYASYRGHFLEMYQKLSSISIENIRLFEAASLFTSAASGFSFQRGNWKNEVELLLSEAEMSLG